jgi:hypothetical protein
MNDKKKPPDLVPKKLPLAFLLELQLELYDLPFGLDRLISRRDLL